MAARVSIFATMPTTLPPRSESSSARSALQVRAGLDERKGDEVNAAGHRVRRVGSILVGQRREASASRRAPRRPCGRRGAPRPRSRCRTPRANERTTASIVPSSNRMLAPGAQGLQDLRMRQRERPVGSVCLRPIDESQPLADRHVDRTVERTEANLRALQVGDDGHRGSRRPQPACRTSEIVAVCSACSPCE